jgi:hypothetical protein
VAQGQYVDRLGLGAVRGYRPVVVAIGSDQVGQYLGVARVGLAPARW